MGTRTSQFRVRLLLHTDWGPGPSPTSERAERGALPLTHARSATSARTFSYELHVTSCYRRDDGGTLRVRTGPPRDHPQKPARVREHGPRRCSRRPACRRLQAQAAQGAKQAEAGRRPIRTPQLSPPVWRGRCPRGTRRLGWRDRPSRVPRSERRLGHDGARAQGLVRRASCGCAPHGVGGAVGRGGDAAAGRRTGVARALCDLHCALRRQGRVVPLAPEPQVRAEAGLLPRLRRWRDDGEARRRLRQGAADRTRHPGGAGGRASGRGASVDASKARAGGDMRTPSPPPRRPLATHRAGLLASPRTWSVGPSAERGSSSSQIAAPSTRPTAGCSTTRS